MCRFIWLGTEANLRLTDERCPVMFFCHVSFGRLLTRCETLPLPPRWLPFQVKRLRLVFSLVVLSNGALCNVRPVFDPIPFTVRIAQPIHFVAQRALHGLLVC